MSDAIKSLCKAQMEMGAVLKNAQNPHLKSKYADLGAVLDACLDPLNKNGFALMQPGGKDEHGPYVETIFAHESGEMFKSRVYLIVGKNDMQGIGSAWTYARRYGLLGMAGLAPEDDDGEATKAPRDKPQQKPQDKQQQKPQERDPSAITSGLIAAINNAATMDDLNAKLAGDKFDAAWAWLAAEHAPKSDEVKAALEAKRESLAP